MVPMRQEHLEYLAANARPDEVAQWEYFQGRAYAPSDVVAYVRLHQGPAFCVLADGVPVAAGGYFYVAPGRWSSWMIGTMEGWALHWRSITKAARWMMWAMFQTGAQRLETLVQPSREKTCEWYIRALGLKRETDSLYVRAV